MAKTGKSAFVSNLASNKKALAAASKTTRTVLLDDSEIIEKYDLRVGDRKVVKTKLVSAKCGVHEDGKYEDLPYVTFTYALDGGPLSGGSISCYIPAFDRKTLEVTEDSMGWVYRELQGFGYDTSKWGDDPTQIEEAISEVNKERPACMLLLAVNEIKNGPRAGTPALNKSLQRVVAAAASSGGDDDGDDEEEAPAPKKPAPKADAKKPAAKAQKATKVAPEPEPEDEDEDVAGDDGELLVSEGDTVKFTFEDEESGDSEEVTGTVEAINEDGTYKVNDGTYLYDVAGEDIIEVVVE
jgi:hypothetical protein